MKTLKFIKDKNYPIQHFRLDYKDPFYTLHMGFFIWKDKKKYQLHFFSFNNGKDCKTFKGIKFKTLNEAKVYATKQALKEIKSRRKFLKKLEGILK